MKPIELSLAQIGNSRGIRLPAEIIRRHGFERGMLIEDRGHEIAIIPKGGSKKLSWDETYKEMAGAKEDWSAWESTLADGLDEIPWEGSAQKRVRAAKRKPAPLSPKALLPGPKPSCM